MSTRGSHIVSPHGHLSQNASPLSHGQTPSLRTLCYHNTPNDTTAPGVPAIYIINAGSSSTLSLPSLGGNG